MNKTLTLAAAAAVSVLAFTAGTAQAQAWMSINERQANLDVRIDQGVRSGDLTRREAVELRGAFNEVAALENRYRANGLSAWEREDLDRRFDALSQRIRLDRNDGQDRGDRWGDWREPNGGWMNINRRQEQLDRRIDQGIRNGKITRNEAIRLRSEFQAIVRIENRYRVNGLSAWERTDLDRRFDGLAARIRWERTDGDRYGRAYGDRR